MSKHFVVLDECGDSSSIDSKSIVFWRNGTPSLDFTDSNVITHKGVNLIAIQPDIDREILSTYILAYYRILTPDTIYVNIKNMGNAT